MRLNRALLPQFLGLILIPALANVGLYVGWRTVWFLTDDAYIAFGSGFHRCPVG